MLPCLNRESRLIFASKKENSSKDQKSSFFFLFCYLKTRGLCKDVNRLLMSRAPGRSISSRVKACSSQPASEVGNALPGPADSGRGQLLLPAPPVPFHLSHSGCTGILRGEYFRALVCFLPPTPLPKAGEAVQNVRFGQTNKGLALPEEQSPALLAPALAVSATRSDANLCPAGRLFSAGAPNLPCRDKYRSRKAAGPFLPQTRPGKGGPAAGQLLLRPEHQRVSSPGGKPSARPWPCPAAAPGEGPRRPAGRLSRPRGSPRSRAAGRLRPQTADPIPAPGARAGPYVLAQDTFKAHTALRSAARPP